MSDREIARWITVKGVHIPVYEDGSIGTGEMDNSSSRISKLNEYLSKLNPTDVHRSEFKEFHDTSWKDKLTREQLKSITDYTIKTDQQLNSSLRQGDLSKNEINAIDSAIAEYMSGRDIYTYRGVDINALGLNTSQLESPDNLVGYKLPKDNAYISSSLYDTVARSFLTTPDKSVIMRIIVPAGKGRGAYIGEISKKPSEAEFLIKRNATFTIVNVDNFQASKDFKQITVLMED